MFYNNLYNMSEVTGNSFPVGTEERQQAREQNEAEFNRRSMSRIYTVEETREYPDAFEIYYGDISQNLPIEAKGKVKPGTKILVVQQSDEPMLRIKGVYVLGENLKEKPKEPQPPAPFPPTS